MKDPLDALEAFYRECGTSEPPERLPRRSSSPWPALCTSVGVGVAATLAVAILTPRPKASAADAARWVQQVQVARTATPHIVEDRPWRG